LALFIEGVFLTGVLVMERDSMEFDVLIGGNMGVAHGGSKKTAT
jgi:hypothetical protein